VTAFVLTATAMVVVALAWILIPLLRPRPGAAVDRAASNAAVLGDELAELDANLAAGLIPADRYEQARRELEARVLDESGAAPTPRAAAPPGRAGGWSAAIVGAALPLAAVVLYLLLGAPEALLPQAQRAGDPQFTPAQIEAMVQRLQAKLDREPANAEGWTMLARTYYVLQRYPEAARAFERAVALAPDVPDLLADYADALAAAAGGSLEGPPLQLVQRALAIDPAHWKALALAGTAAFNRQDYRQAVAYWERLRPALPPQSDVARSIAASIAEARTLGGLSDRPAPTEKR
jgi:cytochrome c-type biogenesis protein CcmH